MFRGCLKIWSACFLRLLIQALILLLGLVNLTMSCAAKLKPESKSIKNQTDQIFKHPLRICLLIALALELSLSALVVETKDIHETLLHPDEGSLYVFDLDNTLIEPKQHLGSEQWVDHQLKSLTQQGASIEIALQAVIPRYFDVQNQIEMKLVDPSSPALFSKLREKQADVIGLTKRNPEIADRTLQQLESLHIDFGATAPLKGTYLFKELGGTWYKKGIIFTARGIDKGPSLVAYLKKLKKPPKRVIMIDDKMSHLANVEKALEPLNIPFIGIRYGALDEKVKAFNPQVADLQLEHLHKVLSDEQALHLLQLKATPITSQEGF